MIQVGDRIYKTSGDYSFEGEIMAIIKKRSGAVRYAVEDDRGILMIMNEKMFSSVLEKRSA